MKGCCAVKPEPPSLICRGDKGKIRSDPFKAVYPDAFAYYDRLQRVQQHIDQHLTDKISLKTAARIAGLEEKYFSAFFRAKTGICFKEWLTLLRIGRATEIMGTRNHSITYIALAVGFQDLRTFERAFKRCAGMTPRAFKRLVRPS